MGRRRGGAKGVIEREAAYVQLNDDAALAKAWAQWRACDVVICVADGAPVALNVDATVATYRFVCTECGNSSPWFEASADGVQARSSAHMKTERPGMPDT